MTARSAAARATSAALAVTVLVGCASTVDDSAPSSPELRSTSADPPAVSGSISASGSISRQPSFTQGLELSDDGQMVHSRGRYGESGIDILSATGQVVRSQELPDDEFGEGVTVVPLERGSTAYQLTWKSGVVHTWSVPGLAPGPSLEIEGEGWGICYDRTRDVLWQSDGSATLHALAVDDLDTLGETDVAQGGEPVTRLNELECVAGSVWANLWRSDDLVQIDPDSGAVTERVRRPELRETVDPAGAGDVLNGIAYDERDGSFLLTGKNWDRIFRVDLPQGGALE